MIWFLIGLIVFVIISIRIFCDRFCNLGEKFLFSFATLLATLFFSIILFIISSEIISACVDAEYKVVSDNKIYALKDDQNINGSFYIGTGHIEEKMYYFYIDKTEYGYKTNKVLADNTYVEYTKGKPHIKRLVGDFKNKNLYWLGCPVWDDKYIIYCPKGTITNEFKIDLE